MEAQIVAAADNADVIAKCMPLENKGSMKARKVIRDAPSLATRLTSGIAHDSIARTRMRSCRVAEITRHANCLFSESPRSNQLGKVGREVEGREIARCQTRKVGQSVAAFVVFLIHHNANGCCSVVERYEPSPTGFVWSTTRHLRSSISNDRSLPVSASNQGAPSLAVPFP